MTEKEAAKILRDDEKAKHWSELGFKSVDDFNKAFDEAYDMAIKALEKVDDVKNHKFLSPMTELFDKLPEHTKGYQLGWNDALDAFMNDFEPEIYKEAEHENN